jgi:hypothetical protein
MKMKLLFSTSILVLLFACKKDNPQLGPAPTAADAAFTYTPSVFGTLEMGQKRKELLLVLRIRMLGLTP